MADSITSDDLERVDKVVDPDALNQTQIDEDLREEGLTAAQANAFKTKLAQAREPIRAEARSQLANQISEPGANGRRQLYGPDPDSGRNTFVGTSQNVDFEVMSNGEVQGVNVNTGTRAVVGQVNLDRRDFNV